MVAARLGCQSAMVGTGWAYSHPGCIDRLRKRSSHLLGGLFLAGKAAWALSRCMTTESADHCMLSQVCLLMLEVDLQHRFSFGVRDWSEMEIRCVKGMSRLKLYSLK